MERTLNSPVLKMAAQLSVGYLNNEVRSAGMSTSCRILFNGNNAQFLSKVDQKVSTEDIFWSPVTVNTGGNHLTLSLETRRTHGGEKALNFPLVGGRPISLESNSVLS